MVDPIQIKVVGEDDSERALKSAADNIEQVGEAGEAASKGLRELGDAASEAGDKVAAASTGASKFNSQTASVSKSTRQAAKDTEEYTSRLDATGESADGLETRFTGLASGIDGVTSIMDDPTPQEFAQGLADISDGVANSFVPAIKRAWEGVGNFLDRMGGMKIAAGIAGVAALGALTAGLMELDQQLSQETSENLDDLSLKLQSASHAATPANVELIKLMASIGKLDELWERAKAAGDEQAVQFIELASAAGVSEDQLADYREELDNKRGAEEAGVTATERMTEAMKAEADAVRGVNDARRAAVDPLFAMLDAMNQQRDSQRAATDAFVAYGEAVEEHGKGSVEAADALRDLNDAQDDAVMSAADLESAASDLEAQIKEHPATLSNAILSLGRWRAQGSLTADEAARMEVRFRNAAREKDRINGTSTARLRADDRASGKIISAGNRLRELDGSTANVTIQAFARLIGRSLPGASFLGLASGGIVGDQGYSTAAVGGPRGNTVLVGEHGPELVDLAPGSQVHSNPDTERMLASAGGGGVATVHINLTGATDELVDVLKNRIRVSYGGDVQAALGWN